MSRRTTQNQVVDFVRDLAKATEPDTALYAVRVMVLCISTMFLEPRYLCAYIKGVEVVNKEKRPCSLKDMMPTVSAASGDVALFEKPTLTPALLLRQTHNLLPSALKAAIIADQYTMLERILKYLVENVKGKRDFGSWKDMQDAAQKIGKALCMAIRLHKNVAGNLLLDFRDKNELFARFAPDELGNWLVKDAIKYCNIGLLYRVLEVDHPGFIAHVEGGSNGYYCLSSQTMETLYRRGRTEIWRMLLEDGVVGPNKVCLDKTPLQHALQRGRYDIAHILIENGAAIDGITPEGHTILWLASNEGHLKDVEFLLNHGADPNSRGKGGISAISAARSSGYFSKCLFLLEAVRDHGKEYLKRPDPWNVYEFEENFRFWYQSRRWF
ncbi:hypothetical protein IG631_02430 [Alternaria alternata]|nr:hypothetical protein IG631_02430 [Alternaria alternata]